MTRKKTDIACDSSSNDSNDWLNEGILFYQAAMELPEYSKEQIDLLVQAADHAHPDACHILLFYISLKIYEFPKDSPPFIHYAYLSNAADGGYISEQFELANYYREKGNNVKAVIYYERVYNNSVANPDDDFELMYRTWACEELATIYLKGTGIVSPYSKKLFYTKEAVYLGSVKFAADLARFYLGRSDDDSYNLIEALIWGLISKAYDDVQLPIILYDLLYNESKSPFDSEQILAIEEEAERRQFILKGENRILTDADVALFYKTFEGGRYYNNVIGNAKGNDESNSVPPSIDQFKSTEPQATTPLPKGAIEKTGAVLSNHNNEDGVNSKKQDVFQEESIDTESLELTNTPTFKHIDMIKKDFDPAKIKLALLLNKGLEEEDTIDFDELYISYNNQKHDRKKKQLYTAAPVRLNKKARLLLTKLALQFDTKDSEKRTSDIARILRDPNLGSDVVSAINRLAKSLFPGCFPKNCPFICKETGDLKIKLAIDRWMIASAIDFKEVSGIR